MFKIYCNLYLTDENMVDPLSEKLGEFDINDPQNMTTNGKYDGKEGLSNENAYAPAVSKDILE